MRFAWMIALVAGLFLTWMAFRGATVAPAGPDRLIVTYGLRGHQGQTQVIRETFSDSQQLANLIGAFDAPDEADIGKRNCPMDIRLDFYQGSQRISSFAASSDGCHTIRLLEGTCGGAGESGFFAVGPEPLKPYIQRQRELASLSERNATASPRR